MGRGGLRTAELLPIVAATTVMVGTPAVYPSKDIVDHAVDSA